MPIAEEGAVYKSCGCYHIKHHTRGRPSHHSLLSADRPQRVSKIYGGNCFNKPLVTNLTVMSSAEEGAVYELCGYYPFQHHTHNRPSHHNLFAADHPQSVSEIYDEHVFNKPLVTDLTVMPIAEEEAGQQGYVEGHGTRDYCSLLSACSASRASMALICRVSGGERRTIHRIIHTARLVGRRRFMHCHKPNTHDSVLVCRDKESPAAPPYLVRVTVVGLVPSRLSFSPWAVREAPGTSKLQKISNKNALHKNQQK